MNKKINEEVVNSYDLIKIVGIDELVEPCSSQYAFDYARDNDMDLVLVNDKLDIPICRIYNINKRAYDVKKNQSQKQNNTKLKTIQLGLDINSNDIEYRVKRAVKWLESKNTVKVSLLIKGGRNTQRGQAIGGNVITSFVDKVNEQSEFVVDYEMKPKLNGNKWISIIIRK